MPRTEADMVGDAMSKSKTLWRLPKTGSANFSHARRLSAHVSEAALPRPIKTPPVILALAPAAIANALGIRLDEVRAGIDSGALPVYVRGCKHRILISDVEAWVKTTWPKPAKRKYTKRKVPDNA